MVSASKDGTWRLWDTDVRYEHGQDPRLLRSGRLDLLKTVPGTSVRVAMAPSGDSWALAVHDVIRVFRWAADTDQPDGVIEGAHSESISALRFSPDSAFLVSAGDRHIRVFHNVSAHRARIAATPALVAHSQSESHKLRLREAALESQAFLVSLGVQE